MRSNIINISLILLSCFALQACAFEDDTQDQEIESYRQALIKQGISVDVNQPVDVIDDDGGEPQTAERKKYCDEPVGNRRTCRFWEGVPFVVGPDVTEVFRDGRWRRWPIQN